MPAGRLRPGWLLAPLLLAALAAHADYKDNYSHGLEAYKDGKYADAQKLMQQALDEHPEPAQRIRLYGQRFEPYLPQHYLGLAAFKQGDCATALAQWNSSANQQIATQLADVAAEQERDSANCGQKAAAQIADKSTTAPNKPTETTPPKPTLADSTPAKPVAPVSKTVVATPAKPPVTAADRPADRPLVPAKSTPPEPLVQAFDSYLAGRYTEVARINPDAFADERARFHAYVVRAAARFTLAELGGDATMLDDARADARAARALDERKPPDAALFSPRFREFYSQTR